MIHVEVKNSIARVTLNRPDVHNAFNDELIALITKTFSDLSSRDDVRAIVVAAAGASFCAGADLNWMKGMLKYTFEENVTDSKAMAKMFTSIASSPKPVIARVHGTALGGGAGLVAAADIAITIKDVQFGFTEVRLGIIPAVISPFVIARIGAGRTREFFTTGERFNADVAQQIGLVHDVVADESTLDAAIETKTTAILKAAPNAIAAAKTLIQEVGNRSLDSSMQYASDAIAKARTSKEGQEGMKAFLQRKKPPWIKT